MSRLMLSSDLHLGHKNIYKFRPEFSSSEEHHEVLFDNLASNVNKRDSLILLGDIAFDKVWLERIKGIKCAKKLLVCGNHDLDFGLKMVDLVTVYDEIKALYTKRNYWFSHCPIHPQEMRGRCGNIHGHLHHKKVQQEYRGDGDYVGDVDDRSYINVCVEHTNWKPISFKEATGG